MLRANGMGIQKTGVFQFVLSPSKHNKGFAGSSIAIQDALDPQ